MNKFNQRVFGKNGQLIEADQAKDAKKKLNVATPKKKASKSEKSDKE